jgi:hypothetical protein
VIPAIATMTDVAAGTGCGHQMSSASGHLTGSDACAADLGVTGPAGNQIQHQPRHHRLMSAIGGHDGPQGR